MDHGVKTREIFGARALGFVSEGEMSDRAVDRICFGVPRAGMLVPTAAERRVLACCTHVDILSVAGCLPMLLHNFSNAQNFFSQHKYHIHENSFGSATTSVEESLRRIQCMECAKGDDCYHVGDLEELLLCLQCGELHCHSVQKSHMQKHLVQHGHTLAVCCARNCIYCIMCGDFVYHPVFEAEAEMAGEHLFLIVFCVFVIHSFIHSLIHSFTHSFTHSFIHS